MGKPKWQKHEAEWIAAKRKCRLKPETVRMAQELGLNPRKLIKNIPSPSQPWKAPVHMWIRELYARRQEKAARGDAGTEQPTAGRAISHLPAVALPETVPLLPVEYDVDDIPF